MPVVDDITGEAISASSFTKAEYVLYDVTGNEKITRSLNKGIEIDGDTFVITLTAEMMSANFSGPHSHQLVVFNQSYERLPPLFKGKVEIESVV